jgi:hypothetical protein
LPILNFTQSRIVFNAREPDGNPRNVMATDHSADMYLGQQRIHLGRREGSTSRRVNITHPSQV